MPYTIVLVIIGLIVALTKLAPAIPLTHDVAFFIILPPILFQGGLNLDLEHLKRDWKSITLLAIPGVITSTLIVGYLLGYLWHIPLDYALLFGALISPTDPVSVLAIMKKIKTPERLRTILEAESLFNDGTGVVLFMVILAMIESHTPLNIGSTLLQFLLVAGGGALVGGLCGYIIYRLITLITNYVVEVLLTVVLVFGTPLIAESLHCSGIIAIVVAGILMGKGRSSCMTEKAHKIAERFWEKIDLVLNFVIFLIIGLELQVVGTNNLITFKGAILTGILGVLISRALVVYCTMYGCNRFLKLTAPSKWNHILFWGGLRGTIPIILMLQLPEFEYRPLFLSATFGIVLFSIIFQGSTIGPLLKKINE